jgi:hypothetical protein
LQYTLLRLIDKKETEDQVQTWTKARNGTVLPALGLSAWSMSSFVGSWGPSGSSGCSTSEVTVRWAPSNVPPFSYRGC